MSRHKYGDDIEPVRIERPSFAELPSVDELARLAESVEWLLVQVPTTAIVGEDGKHSDPTLAERERFVQELTVLLPAHCVRDSSFLPDESLLHATRRDTVGTVITGMARFSVRRVVTEQALEEYLVQLISAAVEYRALANALIRRLAQQQGVDVSEFAAPHSWPILQKKGRLKAEIHGHDVWEYRFHGVDYNFANVVTEVTVEARLGRGEDFGVFDPGFFLYFINSNIPHKPEYLPLAEMLRNWTMNTRLALEFMERRGVLRRLFPETETYHNGWVLAEREIERADSQKSSRVLGEPTEP